MVRPARRALIRRRAPAITCAIGVAAAILAAGAIVAAAGGHGASRPAAIHHVDIRTFAFVPESLTVAPGDTVVWTNRDLVPHTVTGADARWDSGEMTVGATWRTVVTEGGGYFCRFHRSMTGSIVAR